RRAGDDEILQRPHLRRKRKIPSIEAPTPSELPPALDTFDLVAGGRQELACRRTCEKAHVSSVQRAGFRVCPSAMNDEIPDHLPVPDIRNRSDDKSAGNQDPAGKGQRRPRIDHVLEYIVEDDHIEGLGRRQVVGIQAREYVVEMLPSFLCRTGMRLDPPELAD